MSEMEPQASDASVPKPPQARPALGRGLTWAISGVAVMGIAALLYVIAGASIKPGASDGLQSYAKGSLIKLSPVSGSVSYPPTLFSDAAGQPVRLSAFRGRVVLLNLWATWCAPCKKEMGTLAGLQSAYAGRPFKVVAVSMDEAAQSGAARAFIAAHAPLAFYQDVKHGFLSDLQPHLDGFPTTVLFDRAGRERAILPGEADWTSPEAKALIDRLIGG